VTVRVGRLVGHAGCHHDHPATQTALPVEELAVVHRSWVRTGRPDQDRLSLLGPYGRHQRWIDYPGHVIGCLPGRAPS